jgi:hypothetical protein
MIAHFWRRGLTLRRKIQQVVHGQSQPTIDARINLQILMARWRLGTQKIAMTRKMGMKILGNLGWSAPYSPTSL